MFWGKKKNEKKSVRGVIRRMEIFYIGRICVYSLFALFLIFCQVMDNNGMYHLTIYAYIQTMLQRRHKYISATKTPSSQSPSHSILPCRFHFYALPARKSEIQTQSYPASPKTHPSPFLSTQPLSCAQYNPACTISDPTLSQRPSLPHWVRLLVSSLVVVVGVKE